jgi:hypothetical protein
MIVGQKNDNIRWSAFDTFRSVSDAIDSNNQQQSDRQKLPTKRL